MNYNKISNDDLRKYWEINILRWEKSAYYKSPYLKERLGFLDSLSILFRRDNMYRRMDAAINFLEPYVPGLEILDIGCASGQFAFRLLKVGADRVIGVDITASAIHMAKKRSNDSVYLDKLDFFKADVTRPNTELPKVDLVTALGVIEYFDSNSLATFLNNLKARYFFLSFPIKQKSGLSEYVLSLLRKFYLRLKHCPGVYSYSVDEFSNISIRFGFADIWLVNYCNFYFITNLPKERVALNGKRSTDEI